MRGSGAGAGELLLGGRRPLVVVVGPPIVSSVLCGLACKTERLVDFNGAKPEESVLFVRVAPLRLGAHAEEGGGKEGSKGE